MLEFIINNLATIIISLILIAILALVIRKIVRDRKKGTTCSCGSDCGCCSGSSICHGQSPAEKQ